MFKLSLFNFEKCFKKIYLCHRLQMVVVAQLVRALVCGTRGRRFETGLPPRNTSLILIDKAFFVC